jgi:signal transduction histidine kinase
VVNVPATLGAVSAPAVFADRQGRGALAVRVSWLALAVVVAGLSVSGLPGYVQQLAGVCQRPTCESAELTPEKVAGLAAAGLTPLAYATWLALLTVAVAVVFAGVGGLLVWRQPTDRMALLAAFALLLFGGVTFTEVGPFVAPAYPGLRLPYALLDLLGRVSFTAFVFVFPDGRFVPGWTRWVALIWIAVQAPVPFLPAERDTPARAIVEFLTDPAFVVGLATAALGQVYRYRRVSTPAQRQQTRWTASGFAIALGVFLALGVVQHWAPGADEPIRSLAIATLAHAAMTLVPLSLAVALLWHGLYDVDALIGRTLVYGALTACIVAIYMLVVGYLGSLFRTDDNLLISLLATGAAAAVFQPLRERLQRTVNRLLYGERDEPYAVLSDLGRRLDTSVDPAAMLPTVVETIARALKLPYTAIRAERDGGLADVAAAGGLTGPPLRLPLVHQGEPMGELVLGRRGRGEPFGPADRRLLDDLARQAAAAVHAVRLTADLQRSRQGLVNAREEERRRLRRDLHDGLGPTLAALGLKLETARNRLGNDPQADALLADLAERTQAAVADIRRLVYALRPPALDELGLVGALRQVASASDTHAPDGLLVGVEASDRLPSLPAAVEVAAFRITQEAVTNVVRHARARTCAIRLQLADAALRLSIEDDGVGLPASRRVGVGLASMRERAEELGGTFTIQPRPGGGTGVQVVLPLPVEAGP